MRNSGDTTPTLADEMVAVSYGDVMHAHPYERGLTEIYAEEVSGHRCIVRVSMGHVAMLGYEVATGRIVGTIASRPPASRAPARASRKDFVAELIAKAGKDDEAKAGSYGLGESIRNHFLLDDHPCSGAVSVRPGSRSLDRHLPCWRTLEDIAGRIDRDIVDLPLPYEATPAGYAWLALRDALRPQRHALMRAFWFAGDELLRIRDGADLGLAAGLPGEEIALEALCAEHPAFRTRAATGRSRRRALGALAAIAGFRLSDRYLCFQALKAFVEAELPWDRLPGTCADWLGLAGIQVMAYAVEPRDTIRYRRLLDVPGGRYAALWSRIVASPLGRNVREGILQSGWIRDMSPEAVEGNVLVNIPHDAAGEVNRIVARCASFLILPLARSRGTAIDPDGALGVAAGLILRDRSLMGLAEAWQAWMRIQPAMSEALAVMAEGESMRWPALTRRNPLRRGGLDLRWLVDPGALIDEGSRGRDRGGIDGLDHCVATYMDEALAGRSHILSVRRRRPDGGWERLSTAEFASNRDEDGFREYGVPEFALAQHRGCGNGEPPGEAARAVRGVLRDLNAGRLAVDPEATRVRPSQAVAADPDTAMARLIRDEAGIEAMLRVFEPLLARDLRGLGLDGFAGRVLPRD